MILSKLLTSLVTEFGTCAEADTFMTTFSTKIKIGLSGSGYAISIVQYVAMRVINPYVNDLASHRTTRSAMW